MRTMPVQPEYLRAGVSGRPVKVDRERDVLLGYVAAQIGPFKSAGRGSFDEQSLREIVSHGNAARGGLKARFTHPDMSSDGLGKFLGRARNFTLGTALDARTGRTVQAVRADLHFDKTAHETPSGDLAKYVMDLAESDPDAISSSLVIKPIQFIPDGKGGMLELDEDDDPPRGVTPLWRVKALHASDIVETGDAVDGLLSAPLSAEQLASALSVGITPELQAALKFDNVVRLSSQLLDGLFAGQPREVVAERCRAYLDRYLSRKFGEPEPEPAPAPTPRLSALAARLDAAAKLAARK